MDLALKYNHLWTTATLDTFQTMIRKKSWWDCVDQIGCNLVGSLIKKFPLLVDQMDVWISDRDSFWIRRSALIFQLKYKHNTDKERLFRYIIATMHEDEFFIQKAIGWTLREYSKSNKKDVKKFLQQHKDKLSKLSYREGSKYT